MKTNQLLQVIIVIIVLTVLVACGSQNNANTDSDVENVASAATKIVANSTHSYLNSSTLLASLAQLYPNGQLPAERVVQAIQELSQNPTALLLTSTASNATTDSSIKQQKLGVTYQPLALSADYQPVKRIQNTTLYGAYFFSIYPTEITTALATNPNWSLEGPAFWASLATGTDLYPVHRFRNKTNGSYLYSIYETERSDIATNYAATFEYEGVAWYARQTAAIGWSALYRFRNKTNGTYLFSAYESEKNAIVATYPDVFALEGIAYYVRQDAPVDAPIITYPAAVTAITPSTAGRGIATTFTITGSSLPLAAILTVQGATCQAPTGNTSTGFSQICTLSGTTGTRSLSVNSATGGTVIDASRSVFVPVLPDTGITSSQCYAVGSDVLASCARTKPGVTTSAYALNSQQDGMVGLDVTAPAAVDGKLGFSYSEVPNPAGGTFSKTDCVKDNLTGLVWEGKPATGPRRASYTYTNYDSTTALQKIVNTLPAAPTQADIDAPTNTVGYINGANANGGICGYTDCRLPAADELQTLMDYSVVSPSLTIDTTWFPNTAGAAYWSSSTIIGADSYARNILFYSGDISFYDRGAALSVRLVRGTSPAKQFVISPNGQEVTDTRTGLIWQRCVVGMEWFGNTCVGTARLFAHEAALVEATTQTTTTNVAWRLPNVKEYVSLLDLSKESLALLDNVAFPATPLNRFWSSTPFAGYDRPWVVYTGGSVSGGFDSRATGMLIRLVRSSP